MFEFIVGVIIGAFLGVVSMCLFFVASKSDKNISDKSNENNDDLSE